MFITGSEQRHKPPSPHASKNRTRVYPGNLRPFEIRDVEGGQNTTRETSSGAGCEQRTQFTATPGAIFPGQYYGTHQPSFNYVDPTAGGQRPGVILDLMHAGGRRPEDPIHAKRG